ncbi:MAG TPA: FtsK/SpoIIIE domain-containing protein, partial [Dermatophilaceae bacterium]|nr:FtsK/SpoIIIE domain-containing protein [Dermatophilaceae bacterium]
AKPQGQRVPLIASVIPLLLAGVLAYVTRSPMMLLFGLMSPVMLLGQYVSDRRHGRISHRQSLARHRASVEELRSAAAAALRREGEDRRGASPDLGIVGQVASTPESSLWQRRPGDDDHLVLRVGIGTQPSRLRLEGEVPRDLQAAVVDEVPVLVDLGALGVLGISGPRARVLSQAASLLLQLATWHSPKDVRVAIFTSSSAPEADWEWSSRLPHAQPISPDSRVASVVSASDESATRRMVSELQRAAEERRGAHRPGLGAPEPSIVVVLDGAYDLRKLPGMAELMRSSPPTGIVWICLDEIAERLPAETTAHLALVSGSAPRATVRGSARVDEDIVPDLPKRAWVEQVARALAPLEDATPDADTKALPSEVGFRALHLTSPLALDPADPAMLASHWSTPERPRTALLGRSASGPYAVDLLADGPHALVGGTTGAGKSELLQTLVAGLAVAHHPEELAFVLVDYKGGSAFKDCARLPHTLGVVTDLDEHLSSRALTSLGAELKRRERILAEHSAKDLADYARSRSATAPLLPRLVLVVDEFKMLADELPHFVDGLVRLAAVGRSLGVHLVLATQRPGGIVSGDMRANIALRVALRVRDRSDSMDVVESPEAAEISDRFPGRALVRSADLDLREIQTAYAGGPYTLSVDSQRLVPTVRPLAWSDLAHEPPRPAATKTDTTTARTELAAVADAALTAAQALALRPIPAPWLPGLPDLLPAASLHRDPGAPDLVPFGLVDRPADQRQDTYCWDLARGGHLALIGGARTGRSTALRTIALSLSQNRSPHEVHLHVLEGSPGQLRHLSALPHVGSVVGVDDSRRARRLVSRLLDEVARRRARAATPVPRIVLLIDGWEMLEDAFESLDHGEPTEQLLRLLRDGLSAGITVAVTGGRALTGGRLSSLFQQRLVLGMSDPLDLTLAGVPPEAVPVHQGPGRAVEPREGCEVQVAFHGTSPAREAQDAVVAQVAAALSATHVDLPQRSLPWRIHPLPERVPLDGLLAASPTDLVVGVGGDSLEPLGFDLSLDGRRILVAGPARSGRSTALL